jgi:adenine-specific DNA-methyltransferase
VKGFVPTPPAVVDVMVGKLFATRQPRPDETLLDPGCGTGAFIEGVLRWCDKREAPAPQIVGIDSDPVLLAEAHRRLGHHSAVSFREENFLVVARNSFDYIIANPPYVPITKLSLEERSTYRQLFRTAVGRFDLYLLFFEQALKLLKPDGRLVFITPEKFLYVQTAQPLREALADVPVEEIELLDESIFGDLVTYPTITTVSLGASSRLTRVTLRDGTSRFVSLRTSGSWLPLISGSGAEVHGSSLSEAFLRISCGVATGADAVYVLKDVDVLQALEPFSFRTLSGRQMREGQELVTTHSMLIPYDRSGSLLPEAELGELGEYLRDPARQALLLKRTCVRRKPWYAFHENPPLADLLQPKILCKDIGARPWFVADELGDIVPRHSVYYLVPADATRLHDLCAYLNSDEATRWLVAHCQRAANGFVRLQSHVLKQMPLPDGFAVQGQLAEV